jgi:hypothetical protein
MKDRWFSPIEPHVSMTKKSCWPQTQHTGKGLGLLCGHSAKVSQIALVSNQHDDNVSISMVPKLLQPSCDVLVGLMLADIVDEEGTNSTSVVGGRDGAISLLSGGVPDLCLDGLGVHLDRPRGELDTDCRLGVKIELVAGESTKQVGLSDARVSNQDN